MAGIRTIPRGWNQLIRSRTTRAFPDEDRTTTDDLEVLISRDDPTLVRLIYVNNEGLKQTRTIQFK